MQSWRNTGLLLFVLLLTIPVTAQWPSYPTAGVPRLRDGRVDMAAPAPRTPDGTPDLSGIRENVVGAAGGRGARSAPPRRSTIS
jgi:hypothetical protein